MGSACTLWRTLWLTLWELSRIPWKVCFLQNNSIQTYFFSLALLVGEIQHFSLYKMRTRVFLFLFFFFYDVDLCRSQQGLGQRSVVRQLIYNVIFSVSRVILNRTELKLGLQHSHVQMYASLCNFSDKVIRVLQSRVLSGSYFARRQFYGQYFLEISQQQTLTFCIACA